MGMVWQCSRSILKAVNCSDQVTNLKSCIQQRQHGQYLILADPAMKRKIGISTPHAVFSIRRGTHPDDKVLKSSP